MKKLILSSFLLISFIGFRQCPSSQIILTSQSEVDALAASWPGRAILLEDLIIIGNEITNLSGLCQLMATGSNITIENNSLLVIAYELCLCVVFINFIRFRYNPLLVNSQNFTQTATRMSTLFV